VMVQVCWAQRRLDLGRLDDLAGADGKSVGSRAPTPEVSVGASGAAEIESGPTGRFGGAAGRGVT